MADTYILGSVVPLTFNVTDSDGLPANATASSLSITKPAGGTDSPTLLNTEVGLYTYDYLPNETGRFIAVATFTGTNAGQAVDVFDVVAVTLSLVTLADVKAYLGLDHSWSDSEIQGALDAERAAQAKRCRIDKYGSDLREALFRRVARNLAARAVPVASFTSFEGGIGSTRVPMTDPEIMRLEAPYRRLVVG